jgi:HTH-type transcriptional regulator/antitoxin HipB
MIMESLIRLPKQFGAAIRRERRRQGLTQKELGDKISTRQATISSLEAGAAKVHLETTLKVLAALDCELVMRPRTKAPWDELAGKK